MLLGEDLSERLFIEMSKFKRRAWSRVGNLMKVDEAKGMCKHRGKWKDITFLYLFITSKRTVLLTILSFSTVAGMPDGVRS
jgi:hypothetical protein